MVWACIHIQIYFKFNKFCDQINFNFILSETTIILYIDALWTRSNSSHCTTCNYKNDVGLIKCWWLPCPMLDPVSFLCTVAFSQGQPSYFDVLGLQFAESPLADNESTAATKKTIFLGLIINRPVCITMYFSKHFNLGASIRHHIQQLVESINNP